MLKTRHKGEKKDKTMKNIKDMNIIELNTVLAAIAAKEAKGKNLTALESFQKDIIPALIAEKENSAKLQEKVNSSRTTKVRTTKEADNKAVMLLETFKALKSFVVFADTHKEACKVFEDTAKLLKITVTSEIVKSFIDVSIFHNSHSNIKKQNDSKGKPYPYLHYKGMIITFVNLLKEADILTGKKLLKSDFEAYFDRVLKQSYQAITEPDKKEAEKIIAEYFKPAK